MTTWYFDSANGSDGNNGTSSSTPKKNYDAFTFASATPGDTYLFKRGTTQTIVTPYKDARSGASNTFRTRYGAYGEAQVPYSIWINPSAVGNMILNVSGRSYIDFEDMYFDGQAVCLYSLYMLASGATPCNGHRLARCYFTNMAITGSGLVIGGTATSTGQTTDYLIEETAVFALIYRDIPGLSAYPGSFGDLWQMFLDNPPEGPLSGLANAHCLRIDFSRR